MIDLHSKYDNMYMKRMSDVLISINNLIASCINFMLSTIKSIIDKNFVSSFVILNSLEILVLF